MTGRRDPRPADRGPGDRAAGSEAGKPPAPSLRGRGAAANPPNRFLPIAVEREGWRDPDDPDPETRFLQDGAKSILARNESPDVGFDVSLNPYRGCEVGCAYCLHGDTSILMGDGTVRPLAELRVGDEIYGTMTTGTSRRLTVTRVLDRWRVRRPAYRVTLANGTVLIAGGDHRFLTNRGWKFVSGTERGRDRRPHLTDRNRLVGMGAFHPERPERAAYRVARRSLAKSGFDSRLEPPKGWTRRPVRTVRLLGGLREHVRFFQRVQPAIVRKRDFRGRGLTAYPELRVASVEPLNVHLKLYDITTGTGDFIANGVVSHNCYARPTHEYLGFSAGLDWETKIVVKEDAPELLRKELSSPRWKPQVIVMSGVTDPYQPVERRLGVTRRCLEVLAEFRNPVSVITKRETVTRDIDLLSELARHDAAAVTLSVTSLDRALQRLMEPRASVPGRRLEAIRKLSEAGIPAGVMVAPVIPGLTDHEIPAILTRAAEAGATRAAYVMLRLPHGLKELFEDWLERHHPDRKEKVLNRLRDLRGGSLYDPRFGSRMRGEGPFAEQVRRLFEVAARKAGLNRERRTLSTAAFRRPSPGGQLALFE